MCIFQLLRIILCNSEYWGYVRYSYSFFHLFIDKKGFKNAYYDGRFVNLLW